MTRRRSPSVTPEEARRLHDKALVIDSKQPPATSGFLFTDNMKKALAEYSSQGLSRREAERFLGAIAVREIRTSPAARKAYLDLWNKSGVTVASSSYSGYGPVSSAFEEAVREIGQAYAYISALDGELLLVRKAQDIERIHEMDKHGIILDFQNTTPFGEDLDRVDTFYNLGVRMVQLTYNLQNLVGSGCTETHGGGLTSFGREVVRRLNEVGILVDVSHCNEATSFDALEVSTDPIIVSHSSSKAVCYHDRGKSDELAKAVADREGYFGVDIIPGFISASPDATLDDFAQHVEHLVDLIGIDHVGIGTDKAGPGPGTDSMIEYPENMPRQQSGAFDYSGFRLEEHRLTPNYHLKGFNNFGDWPNLTIHLAQRGFNEEELRKLLGLNFLRIFREVVG